MIILRELRTPAFYIVSVPAIIVGTCVPGFAMVYLSLEQAQATIFPGQNFTPISLTLSKEEQKAIEEKSGLQNHFNKQRIWRTTEGGYFIVDEVIGKHEFITYALGINPDGSLRQIEIMDYRETYGYQIRQKKWRRQFAGKTSDSALKLNDDIKNISGATLSCRHVTEGVKRILALYELVLKK